MINRAVHHLPPLLLWDLPPPKDDRDEPWAPELLATLLVAILVIVVELNDCLSWSSEQAAVRSPESRELTTEFNVWVSSDRG